MRLLRGTTLFLLLMAAGRFAHAETGVVTTRDGHEVSGEIIEHETSVQVVNRGVHTRIPNDQILSIQYVGKSEVEFRRRMSRLAADDVKGRVDLARWAFEAREYALAREALESAAALDPNNREVSDFQNLVFQQIRLERERAKSKPTTDATAQRRPGPLVLNEDEINRIRQAEWMAGDRNVRARLNNSVARRYGEYAGSRPGEFTRMSPADQAFEIVRNGTDDMRRDVRILNDPGSIAEFRRVVQPRVISGCATTNCHGGARAVGGFKLLAPADQDPVAYTNFFVLSTFQKEIKGRTRLMLDRTIPDASLLLQYMLPLDQSDIDHPRVRGMREIVHGTDDPAYKGIYRWLAERLSPVQPDYDIEFESASIPPTTQPVSVPVHRRPSSDLDAP